MRALESAVRHCACKQCYAYTSRSHAAVHAINRACAPTVLMQSRIQALPEHVRLTAEREREIRNLAKERVDSKLGHHAGELARHAQPNMPLGPAATPPRAAHASSAPSSHYVGVRCDPRTGKFYGSINSGLLIPG
jgi:hypothetical protein